MQSLHTPDAATAASFSVAEKATRDLISALERVGKHLAAGNVAANAPAAWDREPTTDELAAPGLLQLIERYRRGKQDFNNRVPAVGDPTGSLAGETYEPPMEEIRKWTGPAEDRQAALAALYAGLEEVELGDNETAHSLLKATHAYFRRDLYGIPPQKLRREDVWEIDDAVTQVDGVLCLALRALSHLSDGLIGNPLIHDVAAMERALQLGRERLDFASDRLGEIISGIQSQQDGD